MLQTDPQIVAARKIATKILEELQDYPAFAYAPNWVQDVNYLAEKLLEVAGQHPIRTIVDEAHDTRREG